MSRLSKEELARYSGAEWILAKAEKEGVEAARKELDWRGVSGIPLGVKQSDLNKFCEEEKQNTVATIAVMACITLVDEFDFAPEQVDQFWRRFTNKTECLLGHYVNWKEMLDILNEETGIGLTLPEIFFKEEYR